LGAGVDITTRILYPLFGSVVRRKQIQKLTEPPSETKLGRLQTDVGNGNVRINHASFSLKLTFFYPQ